MQVVQVTSNGTLVGTVEFRGIVGAGEAPSVRRKYRCNPKACVPRSVARSIANGLSAGSSAGHEDIYAWRT